MQACESDAEAGLYGSMLRLMESIRFLILFKKKDIWYNKNDLCSDFERLLEGCHKRRIERWSLGLA